MAQGYNGPAGNRHSPLPGVIEMVSGSEFQIVTDTATYLDANTYEISSSAEEDL